jgi:hypothetical protein
VPYAQSRIKSLTPVEKAEIANTLERLEAMAAQPNTAELGRHTGEESDGAANGLGTDTRVGDQPDLALNDKLRGGGGTRLETGIEPNQGMSFSDRVRKMTFQEPSGAHAGTHKPVLPVGEPSALHTMGRNWSNLDLVDHRCPEKPSSTLQSDIWNGCHCDLPLSRRRFRPFSKRLVAVSADCVSLVAAGVAVGVILRFHHQSDSDQSIGEKDS